MSKIEYEKEEFLKWLYQIMGMENEYERSLRLRKIFKRPLKREEIDSSRCQE